MTVVIELTPEQEARLRDEAEKRGMNEQGYLQQIVAQHFPVFPAPRPSLWDTLTPEEWSRQTREWVQSHDHKAPILSDYAVSRESIYEDGP